MKNNLLYTCEEKYKAIFWRSEYSEKYSPKIFNYKNPVLNKKFESSNNPKDNIIQFDKRYKSKYWKSEHSEKY